MRQDNQEKFSDLAYDLHKVHTNNIRPYILFLGGTSSKVEGHTFLDMLRWQVLLEPRGKRFRKEEIDKMDLASQIEHFTQKWSEQKKDFRLSVLSDLQRRAQPTPGYNELAALLKERYFPLVLTTTLDQLLEATFINYVMKNGQAPPAWKTLVNGADIGTDAIKPLPRFIPSASSVTTVLKLCGSINMESFAVTRSEVEEKIQTILNYLIDLFQYNLIIVGVTALDEVVLQQIFQAMHNPSDVSIYYINATDPSNELNRWLKRYDTTYIVEEEINFDSAFQMLAQQFRLISKVETIGGTTLDQAGFERLRNQQSQTEEQTVVDYLKSSVPQRRPGTSEAPFFSPSVQSNQSPLVEPMDVATPPTAPPTSDTGEPLIELYEDEPPEPETLIELIEPRDDQLVQLMRDTTVITLSLRADRRATFTVKDRTYYNFSSQESDELKFNLSDLNKDMRYMGEEIAAYHRINVPQVNALRDGWRARAKQVGINLYRNLIQPIPELESMLEVTRGTAAQEDPANVTLVFNGPRQYLSMPYELLYYRDFPLMVQHPICRQVSGVNVRGEHFDDFFSNLRQRKQALRILLIASGTPGTTSDEQVLELEKFMGQTIREQFGFKFKPVIDKLLTKQASIKAVKDRLRNCRYHIVHYAGHGTFDETTGENSGLTFWQRENMSGERVTLTAREIASLLSPSEVRLFYINACVGAEASSDQVLHGNEYLGIMDALVQAKVPYVLGFRWYVTDRGSRYFASLFYEYLFRRPLVPEQAVLHARKRIYEEDPTDETWTSPILVAQTPYQ
jgi:CHAT domain-containing protein